MSEDDKKKDSEKELEKATSTKSTEKKKSDKNADKSKDKKPEKMTAGIDPKLAAKFKEKSAELKERIYKEQLEDRIRSHTISPMKAIVPGVVGIILVISCIVFFSNKAETMMGGVNPATAPRIKAEGEKAVIPSIPDFPITLKTVEDSYYTDTPDDALLKGGYDAVQEQKKAVQDFKLPLEVSNEIGMHFRLIPPGKFIMGSPENEEFREEDEFQHLSNIKVPFYVGKHEVTVKQWEDVLGHLPNNSQKNPDYPVTGISLNDALVFVQELNRKL
ncbi:MAG: SUMF1/EgtB/PvdO family nonheme iron enzyme, partial [Lentisphaeraceae bacterium]|nr:SUMF1/EgtB/PvdO family nonheme iron enzyme [Lentisphaeraceae bacterium]